MRNLIVLTVLLACGVSCIAEDWPTWQHDQRRSGFSGEQIDAAHLDVDWSWQSNFPPQPAWHGPAKWDAYARIRDLPAMRNYDQVFHVVAVGDSAFFGSSADDSVRCLELATGKELWKVVTDGPVRVAPLVANGRVYFGSDDGFVYCLKASTGELHWKFRPVEPKDRILNNGRFIPLNPCRTGVVLNGNNVWFACGMLPWHPSWLCSVNAETGLAEGDGTFVRKLTGKTIEGAPAVSSDFVLFPQGRVAPQVFNKADGKDLGSFKKSGGGSIVVVALDSSIFHGPATDSRRGGIGRSDPKTREMVAGYGKGSALAVSDRVSYMLADDELIASDLATRKVLFQVPCEQRLSLVGAKNVVFAGGEDSVSAFDSATGNRIWQHEVVGKVYGLAVANGRLIASTDTGRIYAFVAKPANSVASETSSQSKLPNEPGNVSGDALRDAVADKSQVSAAADKRLLGKWLFDRSHVRGKVVVNLAGGRAGRTVTGPLLKTFGDRQALELDGGSQGVVIADNHRDAKVPRRAMSVEAWVRVDEPQMWGGIVGAIQDNGDFERGWLLGYRETKFSFAVAGTEGNGRLTYLTAEDDFTIGSWYHLAATYDGSEMVLYVNGRSVATSKQQAGDIHYPPQAFYEIGAYHDKDEQHRLRGAIHEIGVYDDVLAPQEIATNHALKAGSFPEPAEKISVKSGPWLEFTGSNAAVVRWETAELTGTSLELSPKSGRNTKAVLYEDASPKRQHEINLRNLKRNRIYSYVIQSVVDGKSGQTREFECDTFFDYTLPVSTNSQPVVKVAPEVSQAADVILEQSGVDRGVAFVVGLTDGQLVRSLCRNSRLRVIAVDDDPSRVKVVRDSLNDLYGVRVAVHLVDDLESLPFAGYFANLVTTERPLADGLPTTFEKVVRLLRPDGGVAVFGSSATEGPTSLAVEKRATLADELEKTTATKLPESVESTFVDDSNGVWITIRTLPWSGTGEWSHLYGSTDNSAFSGESLSGVRSREDLKVQWVGRPGPRYQADRSGRKPSPLAVAGRLFLQGLERIIALDSYNGSVLWSREIPGFIRFNVPRDSGNWCADRDHVFAVVGSEVWQLEAATGKVARVHKAESISDDKEEVDWGFVARSGDQLIGSSLKPGTSWSEYWGKEGWHDARSGPSTFQVGSDKLFARSLEDGSASWSWSSGVILNSSVTIADGRVYFVESRHPDVISSSERRLGSPEFWQQQFLVSLDARTGSKLWEKPIDTVDGTVAFYMAHAKNRLVVVSSSEKAFHVSTYADDGGQPLWEQKVGWKEGKGDHGKAMSRPAIVGDKLFVRPQVLSLTDGKPFPMTMPDGHGCGTYACTTNALFLRSENVTVWDTESGQATAWPRLRVDCWLSTIPAGGMLLAPEGGGGCSCGSWMETSIGFMPAARR
jgi:outer membrane protein assembly factor BamB